MGAHTAFIDNNLSELCDLTYLNQFFVDKCVEKCIISKIAGHEIMVEQIPYKQARVFYKNVRLADPENFAKLLEIMEDNRTKQNKTVIGILRGERQTQTAGKQPNTLTTVGAGPNNSADLLKGRKKFLNSKLDDLCQVTGNWSDLKVKLVTRNMISQTDIQKLERKDTDTDRFYEMYIMVQKKPSFWNQLLEVFDETGNDGPIEILNGCP